MRREIKDALSGCYVTIPTPFADTEDLPVNEAALRRHVRFLIESGLRDGYATFLAGGAAGDFSTLSFDERVEVAAIVVDEVAGAAPVAMGAQTTSTREVVRLARAARALGAQFIQVSCPFYFTHTEDDFEDFVRAAAEAEPELGIIVYNTFWTSQNISFGMVERLAEIPNIVGLKWATPRTDAMEFEDVTSHFSDRFTIIDNNLFFAIQRHAGARRPRLRGAQLQFLAGMGHQAGRRGTRRQLPGDRAHARRRGDALLQALGRDREGRTPAATAISTSCAWSSSACRRAAAGRRPATSANATATRRCDMLIAASARRAWWRTRLRAQPRDDRNRRQRRQRSPAAPTSRAAEGRRDLAARADEGR